MFRFKKKKMGRPTIKSGERATYKPLAVRPAAHEKFRQMADKKGASLVDAFDELVGI